MIKRHLATKTLAGGLIEFVTGVRITLVCVVGFWWPNRLMPYFRPVALHLDDDTILKADGAYRRFSS